jgi:hypothetical protein
VPRADAEERRTQTYGPTHLPRECLTALKPPYRKKKNAVIGGVQLFADNAYQGSIFHKGVGKILTQLDIEIVKRSNQAKGYVVLPKRWNVQRTIAWLNRCRRLDIERSVVK